METALKAYDTFIGDDSMTAQTVELSLDELYYREQTPYASASQKWVMEDAGKIWAQAYS